jgi:DNA (cytosine-5)-methyltransferase 1
MWCFQPGNITRGTTKKSSGSPPSTTLTPTLGAKSLGDVFPCVAYDNSDITNMPYTYPTCSPKHTTDLTFGSLCSGIEAASVAFGPLGWRSVWLSQFDPEHNYTKGLDFPSAVLNHHYPDVPNIGDMTTLLDRLGDGLEIEVPDIICGGTPCQAFSVAGSRKSLDDARGNLALMFCAIADAADEARTANKLPPTIIFWENVLGVLSTHDNAFGCFLGQLAGEDAPLIPPGGKWTNAGYVLGPKRAIAWRVLDAQYFGVAQRRRRVFVVASARDDVDPRAILFESEGMRRDIAPSREEREEVARGAEAGTTTARCSGIGDSGPGSDVFGLDLSQKAEGIGLRAECAPSLTSGTHAGHGAHVVECARAVCVTGNITHPLKAEGADASEDGTGRGVPIISFPAEMSGTQAASAENISISLSKKHTAGIQHQAVVRRLTPVECERLQGFPDNYTNIPWKKELDSPEGHRYKALGNSWAVPCVRWIGARITWALTDGWPETAPRMCDLWQRGASVP